MTMPLVMLGQDYSRQHLMFGQDDPNFMGPPISLMNKATTTTAGSFDWNEAVDSIAKYGPQWVSAFLGKSKSVAVTPQQQQIIDDKAKEHGITLSQATPWLIGGGALLVVIILLMSKKRR